MMDASEVVVPVSITTSTNPNRQYRCEALGKVFHFGYFAGVIYREHRRYALVWNGETDSPVKVKQL
jgi:hypothetical protein